MKSKNSLPFMNKKEIKFNAHDLVDYIDEVVDPDHKLSISEIDMLVSFSMKIHNLIPDKRMIFVGQGLYNELCVTITKLFKNWIFS